ncbi:hypothetical protein Plhal703r1_c57g0162971 [Plasmopara halstedii]
MISILCLFQTMLILGVTTTKTASSWPLLKGYEGSTTQKLTPPHIKVSGNATSSRPAAKEHLLETWRGRQSTRARSLVLERTLPL